MSSNAFIGLTCQWKPTAPLQNNYGCAGHAQTTYTTRLACPNFETAALWVLLGSQVQVGPHKTPQMICEDIFAEGQV